MGLFNNYAREGSGISKDEKQKNSVITYFELFLRKFWNLCTLNLMVASFLIPFVALSVFLFNFLGGVGTFGAAENLQLRFIVSLVPFAFFGPVIAAASRITRDYVRGEPVFLWSDFFSTLKKNIKQPLVFSMISYIGTAALTYAIPAYYNVAGIGKYVLFPMVMICATILLFMQYYYYTMAITFDLTTVQLIKNAIILSLACFVRNLIITLITGVLIVGVYFLALYGLVTTILIGVLFILLGGILISFELYTISFITFPALKKYIIDPYYANNPQETAEGQKQSEETENTETNVTDDVQEVPDEPKSEYVYHNGRMIHRSVLEEDALFDDSLNTGKRDELL